MIQWLLIWLSLSLARVHSLYIPEKVICGHDGKTYANATEAHRMNIGVMHCGACGACSNRHDIDIYKATRNNLTQVSTRCALISLFKGSIAGDKCLSERVGFTRECQECWVEDIQCNKRYCSFRCLLYKIFGGWIWESHNPEDLNPCLSCDEERCGPAFKKCAGANRRRCGIKSDIERLQYEICDAVDPWPKTTTESSL